MQLASTPDLVGDLLTPVQTSVMGGISSGLGPAGIVMAAIMGIFIAVKIFKRISGART